MRSTNVTIPEEWIKKASFFYLVVPFIIFCFGYLKLSISICITLVFLWITINNWGFTKDVNAVLSFSKKQFFFLFSIILIWVALSGIGGFAFQNTDFHIRNAIFRDLIYYDWPVKYFSNSLDRSVSYNLVYYIGFWLPAALVGKIAGWQAANITLYIWSVLGITLTLLLLATKIKISPNKLILIFVFFSGMDGLGTLIKAIYIPDILHQFWPPISHLEWWISGFQYSSITTQLFWVFNQAIPCWLCMALLYVTIDRKIIFLVWSLCCFFAPLPALGMLPYLVLKIPNALFDAENFTKKPIVHPLTNAFSRFLLDIRSILSFENILGGGIILGISISYFSSNAQFANRSSTQIQSFIWIGYVIFIIFEGLELWWILKNNNKTNLNWYLAGVLLIIIPLIKIGNASDFCMRASIPTIFMLLIWSAETLSCPGIQIKPLIICLLLIGAVTPLFEINRSIYRSANYIFFPPTEAQRIIGQQVKIYTITSVEFDHPYTLVADSFKSLANFDPEQITNFVSRSEDNLFQKYLAK